MSKLRNDDGLEHHKGGLICLRCMNVISLKEVAKQSPEFDAEKIRCPKCGRKWLGGGVLEESKRGKDKDKDK
jgi:Zn-finger nucleic acid-binding protein